MLSRAYVEQILSEGGYFRIFAEAVVQALTDWKSVVASSPDKMGGAVPRERATFLNRRVVELICAALESDPRVSIYDEAQNTLLTVDGEITIRCKKLTEEMRAMNIRTGRVIKLWYNQLPLSGEFSQHINITFGWHLDDNGQLQRLAIVNEYNDKPYWIIDIDEAGIKQSAVEATLLFPEDTDFTVIVRDTERARRIAEEGKLKGDGNSES